MSSSSVKAHDRRGVLRTGGKWLFTSVLIGMCYPVLRFFQFNTPKKPVEIAVSKNIRIGGFHIDKEFILFVDEQHAWAVSRRCTHLGCLVAYNETKDKLICPCHHSQFSKEGTRLAGPAQRNLTSYQVKPAPGDNKGYIVVT